MELPVQDGNWVQNLKALSDYRKEMYNGDNKPCGVWQWFYDEKRTKLKAELVFDEEENPVYMICWYENGLVRSESYYEDGFPKVEAWYDPLVSGYIAFAITYIATTLFNWLQ